jgi:hypothetical protein
MTTTASAPREDQECGLVRWKRVPLRIRAWIVFRGWTWRIRRRLLPNVPLDSPVFHIRTVAQTLWFEVRSLRARIRLQLGSRTQFCAATDLPYYESGRTGFLTLNLGSYARSAGIEAMLSTYPELTAYDELMYLEGWNRAEQWTLYTAGTECRDRVLASMQLLYEDEVRGAYDGMIAECWPPVKPQIREAS